MAASSPDGVSTRLPGRCAFYVAKKKRFCKMLVRSGNEFCGEHADAEKDSKKRRIACPLDPKHTVFEDLLTKHLKKCNSREKPRPVYYVQDINAGPTFDDEGSFIDEVPLVSRSKTELDLLLQKLRTAVKTLNFKHDNRALCHRALNEALNDPNNGDSACKHLKQQASILGNMEALNLLGPNRCYVEFGAGKGKLSHWIHVASKEHHIENIHFLLVERSSTRFKVDGKHQSDDAKFERVQVDIQHLDLRRVPLLRETGLPVVGVGKHLCGAATDLALRCLLDRPAEKETDDQPPSKRHKLPHPLADSTGVEASDGGMHELRVSGLAIALCCHHRCDWRHYVGKEFFRERGLGASEFSAFQRMSSWATCGMRRAASKVPMQGSQSEQTVVEQAAEEDDEHESAEGVTSDSLNEAVSTEDREHIGRLCKLLIDQGRVQYLKQKGYDSYLQYYTSTDVSLENVLLTALPSSSLQ